MTDDLLIRMRDVRKEYAAKSGTVHALDGLNLDVAEGTVRGLLGPNGAGKTTTVKVLTTLTRPTSGEVTIDGLDVVRNGHEVRNRIGVSGQNATIDEELTARENLMLVGRLFHLGDKGAKKRADELLEIFNLEHAADRPIKGFSGGMRRRADLAASLVNDPRILFLDEPTTGLDPAARLSLWEVIKQRVRSGTTLLLTTQYLEEADYLADQISVIDQGKVIAEGTADELKSNVGGQRISVVPVNRADHDVVTNLLDDVAASRSSVSVDGSELSVSVHDGPAALEQVIGKLRGREIAVHDVGMSRPSLDEVFLDLTGQSVTGENPTRHGESHESTTRAQKGGNN
ncbi:ATP-binding cassette domain-containing protein [Corynebacterium propinquum]|uniref:ATP-binding cassette domain-containing protein n=1 Tax=Corynebacterium propinquum TaxID=43769 RepID=UPI000667EE67|nr:ATP-binding cassette domain-containing protein [Corynebacterium propinquum]MDK4292985.1 ATP-binding cassette domain-containing protein [Corynebacterium propinquum]RUP77736.1 ATP-binding cassette domain-containing protein [Corynebacterium propinquum]RUP88111.1 ATP-binding cassette domain-containing protein [Corynebacterium propinquum]RUP93329.1 ATP-binding cassette domain-containing protein [Corynebacterium propinquum]WKS31603.1 ATP-binding cassette domain-containing protein [Corynebacterium